jgi:integrase
MTDTYKPPKVIKTVGQAVECAWHTNPRWAQYKDLSSSTPKSSTDWFIHKIYTPGFPIENINRPDVWMHLRDEMRNPDNKWTEGKARKNGTIINVVRNINSALNHCFKRFPDNIKGGPWSLTARFTGTHFDLKQAPGRPEFYEIDEILTLADACKRLFGEDLADATLFNAFTGARQGEILRLPARDIDMDRGMIHFEQTKQDTIRSVPIERSILRPMLERRLAEDPGNHNHKVFGDYFRDRHELARHFRTTAQLVMPEKVLCWHTLRNTFIILLADMGYNVTDICSMMMHSSVTVTQRYLVARDKSKMNMINDLTQLVRVTAGQKELSVCNA